MIRIHNVEKFRPVSRYGARNRIQEASLELSSQATTLCLLGSYFSPHSGTYVSYRHWFSRRLEQKTAGFLLQEGLIFVYRKEYEAKLRQARSEASQRANFQMFQQVEESQKLSRVPRGYYLASVAQLASAFGC